VDVPEYVQPWAYAPQGGQQTVAPELVLVQVCKGWAVRNEDVRLRGMEDHIATEGCSGGSMPSMIELAVDDAGARGYWKDELPCLGVYGLPYRCSERPRTVSTVESLSRYVSPG